jgi:hypothetical protein
LSERGDDGHACDELEREWYKLVTNSFGTLILCIHHSFLPLFIQTGTFGSTHNLRECLDENGANDDDILEGVEDRESDEKESETNEKRWKKDGKERNPEELSKDEEKKICLSLSGFKKSEVSVQIFILFEFLI